MAEKAIQVETRLEKVKTGMYAFLLKKAFDLPIGEKILLDKFKKKLHEEILSDEKGTIRPIQEKKYQFLMAMLECARRNYKKGWISKKSIDRVLETLVKYNFMARDRNREIKDKFKKRYGLEPPSFILLSPTQECNLKCEGCYACAMAKAPKLSYEAVDKITGELYNEWSARFMAISGGEPFMYRDEGKTLFDIWKKYNQMFFLVYTNGTLLTKEVCKKLADLGNVTPAISIEGNEKDTDCRRGKGMYKQILKAAKNLREVGVPFGVSVTGTMKNIDTILDEKFYDFIFQELGATYMWQFQIMPVGEAKDLKELTVTPKKRIELYRLWEKMLKEKKYCIADFWNSGILSDGCIAYGGNGGYFHVDWNGNIMPCVFVHYYEDNVIDLFKKGKKLADALNSDLFKRGREWQKEYGLKDKKHPNNWLMPCSIKDHWSNFRKNILTKTAKPEDKEAEEALKSKEYNKTLKQFEKEMTELSEPIWKKEYIEADKKKK